jgi:hypothetical protein
LQDNLHPVHLLIAEYPVIFVVKQEHAQAVRLEHIVFRQMQIRSGRLRARVMGETNGQCR